MAKQSAGILLYRRKNSTIEVLLVHPGGPFWAKKDEHAWSIPKGELAEGEDPLTAARREFREELGLPVPEGEPVDLGVVKRSSKAVYIWALQGDLDTTKVRSNTIEIDWPPRSGQKLSIPEVDRAEWVSLSLAQQKLVKGQLDFIGRLAEKLQVDLSDSGDETSGDQASLF
jgi:predicted NUDIX family NTP pyrophosphohydrolase